MKLPACVSAWNCVIDSKVRAGCTASTNHTNIRGVTANMADIEPGSCRETGATFRR